MRSRIAGLGLALIIAAFAVLIAFDPALRLLAGGFGQGTSVSTGGTDGFAGQRQGAAQLAAAGQGGLLSIYFRLAAYLIGAVGLVLAVLGLIMAPKVKGAVSGGEDHGRSQEPVKQVRIEVPKGGVEGGSLGVDKDGSELQPSSQLDRRSDGDYVIRLDSVAKVYTGGSVATPALQSVSLQILRGEFLAIVGPSGCGKSTLLNIIGALDRPTSGRIFIDGVDLSKLGDGELARLRNGKIGFVFQSFNLIPRMSALWNVEYPLAARNVPVGERRRMAMRTLEMVGLRDKCNRVPPKLSGGEQQRVAVARALATDPAILLGDEPTGNLDSKNSKMLIDLLHKLNKSLGKTIVLITHDMGIAATAQRIIHIKDGLVERVELGRGGYSA